MVELRVLGPVELAGADGPVPLGGDKQRRLLVALAIRAGETLPADVLIDAVWGPAPPRSAGKLLQVYVSQLRKLLEPPLAIATRPGGYALEIVDGALDLTRFERLLQEGRAAAAQGNPALAASLFGRALGLWRGPAFGELGYDDFAVGEARRLEELRLVAREQQLDAELELGSHLELLPELRSRARAQPLRERAQAQAMLALYRCGRQTEALELYSATHACLRDQLGLDPGVELRELQRQILGHDPRLLSVCERAWAPGSLPAAPNALVGREREVEEVRELLARDDVRLLVLAGAGGSGKTRLALEAARAAADSFANGAVFVSLAPVRDPALVMGAIGQACGAPDAGGVEQRRALAAALGPRELLLVLDNFEHVRAAAPTLVELLAAAPRLTVLVTSRAVLHLSGEQVYPVEPLALEAASRLFCARARETDPRFEVDAADGEAIGQICARVDGLPLAIELAAARTSVLSVAQLLERLEPRLPLLAGGPVDLPARQQTLRATLEWSHDLLTPAQQRLFRRLAVFAGGFVLEAVENICEGDLDTLGALVEQSLVRRLPGGRFATLETIRELAHEQLQAYGELERFCARHASYFLALARSANLREDSDGEEHHELALADQENLRTALAWTLASGHTELGLELATALETFWCIHAPLEGRRWFETLFTGAQELAPSASARALRASGAVCAFAGDYHAAEPRYEQSLAAYRALGDDPGIGGVLQCLAANARDRGDLSRARALIEQSIEILGRVGTRLEQSTALAIFGKIQCDEGGREPGIESLERAAAIAGEHGSWFWQSYWLGELSEQAFALGRIGAGEAWARQSLALCRRIGDRQTPLALLTQLACFALQDGRPEQAGRLWGAVEAEARTAALGWWLLSSRDSRFYQEPLVTRLRACQEPGFGHGRDEGHRISLEEAIDYALKPLLRARADGSAVAKSQHSHTQPAAPATNSHGAE